MRYHSSTIAMTTILLRMILDLSHIKTWGPGGLEKNPVLGIIDIQNLELPTDSRSAHALSRVDGSETWVRHL